MFYNFRMFRNELAEGAGIEPAKAYSAHVGFEDREGHQTPSTSAFRWIQYTDNNH